jgi:hypothetical protein
MLAVSFANGGVKVFNINDRENDIENRENDIEIFDRSEYKHFEGGFNGKYFVFSATNSEESVFVSIDTIGLAQTDFLEAPGLIGVTAGEGGVYLTFRDKRVKYDPATLDETDPELDRIPPPYSFEYSVDSPEIRLRKLESNSDKEMFRYDSFYNHDEARISGDGKTIMLFGINGFRLYSVDGEIIAEDAFGNGIYDQQYRRIDERSYLEVIFYDGTVKKYSAADGGMLSEELLEPPDESLYEEFYTDSYRIVSPLHGTPEAFDLKSGNSIRMLEKDAYLTYVTQHGDYIVTEYISAVDGSRYGLLLDGATLETLAYLPNLCDVINGRLIFDIKPGSLRETRIHTIDELITIAKSRENQ